MLIPKKNRQKVYAYLFKEGVLVAKKDNWAPKHAELTDVPNLHVMKLMQSLTSKKLVREEFNWQYFYWFLTNEGIEYLRQYLALPEGIVPDTLKKKVKTSSRPEGERRGPRRDGDRPPRGPRPDGEKKDGAPSGDFKPDFRGGMGRGRAPRGEGEQGGRDSYRREGGAQGGRGGAPQGAPRGGANA